MKVIVYASKYGTTKECARLLSEHIHGADLVDIANESVEVSDYSTIIIGSAIYAGHIRPEIKKFIEDNKDSLINRKIAIFICGGNDEETKNVVKNNFGELTDKAIIIENLGYKFDFDSLNFFEKLIVKKVAKVSKSKKEIYKDRIENFAKKL